jgi:hypothetical protein
MSEDVESPAPGPLLAALQRRYRVERQVGEGGMATVYLAQDVRHDRRVALKPEIYVTPHPGPGERRAVSSGGGREPVWAANGELFYRSRDRRQLFSTMVRTSPELELDEPRLLFTAAFVDATNPSGSSAADYDVTRDGQRFVMVGSDPDRPPPRGRIEVMLNWPGALSAPVP